MQLLLQVKRFACTGLLATTLHITIATLFITFCSTNQTIANGWAYIGATLFSYAVNTKWSFSSSMNRGNLLRFISVSFSCLLITLGIAHLADTLELPYFIGIGCIVFTITPVNFLLHKHWTFTP